MTLNPEFVRNLWLQLSPQRLIAAPVIFGLAALAIELSEADREGLAYFARIVFFILVAIWGTRRAADAIGEEVSSGTWDSQRMSALGAWSMSWGKLLGSTIFVWYCAALCLGIYAYASLPDTLLSHFLIDVATLVAVGLLGQAIAMADCLLFLARGPALRRVQVWAGQVIALFVVLGLPVGLYTDPESIAEGITIRWYGIPVASASLTLVSVAAFAGWALLAVYRLMRQELQYRNYPFFWLLFLVFLFVCVNGFLYDGLIQPTLAVSAWLVAPATIAGGLTYIVLILQPKDVVRFRWLATALGTRDWRRALSLMPLWLPTFAVTAVLIVVFVSTDVADLALPIWPFESVEAVRSFLSAFHPRWPVVIAVLLFMARDIALVLFLSFASRLRRVSLAALLYLLVLYLLLPTIAGLLEVGMIAPLFVPVPGAGPLLTILPPFVEAAIMVGLLVWRMDAARPVRMAAQPA